MKRFLGQFLALLLVCIAAVFAMRADETRSKTLVGGFEIAVPLGVTLTTKDPAEDFTLYSFSDSQGEFLLLYIGNHANPLSTHHTAKPASLNTEFPSVATEWREAAKATGEVRLKLNDGRGWPTTAQFTYRQVTSEQLKIIKQMIRSLSSRPATDPN